VKEALRRDQRGTIRASTTDEPRQRFQCFGCEKKWREVSKRRFCPYCKQPLVMRMGDA
jgi:rRNA maturation endonuclease Nob1